jgi:TrmH family RNA methyltransferase
VFRIPLEREVSLTGPVERVTIAGGEVWATGSSGIPLDRWSPSQPMLLLLGAEGAGLSGRGLEVSGATVTIPLDNEVESLNVSVAAGILLHHLRAK